jgi:hypothetical protein
MVMKAKLAEAFKIADCATCAVHVAVSGQEGLDFVQAKPEGFFGAILVRFVMHAVQCSACRM